MDAGGGRVVGVGVGGRGGGTGREGCRKWSLRGFLGFIGGVAFVLMIVVLIQIFFKGFWSFALVLFSCWS